MNNEYYQQTAPLNHLQAKQDTTNNIAQNKSVKVPEAFIETSMFLNIGQTGAFHMSFPDSEKEKDMIFYGKIVEATRDHIVIHDSRTDTWYMLPLLYLNYTEFKQKPVLVQPYNY